MELKKVGTLLSVDEEFDEEAIRDKLDVINVIEWVPFNNKIDSATIYRKLDEIEHSKEDIERNGIETVREMKIKVGDTIVRYGIGIDRVDFPIENKDEQECFYFTSDSVDRVRDTIKRVVEELEVSEYNTVGTRYRVKVSDELELSDEYSSCCLPSKLEADCSDSDVLDSFYLDISSMRVFSVVEGEGPSEHHVEVIEDNIKKASESSSFPPEIVSYRKAYSNINMDIPVSDRVYVEKGALFSEDDLIVLEDTEDGRVVYFKNKHLIGAKSKTSIEKVEDKLEMFSDRYGEKLDKKKSTCVAKFSDWKIQD